MSGESIVRGRAASNEERLAALAAACREAALGDPAAAVGPLLRRCCELVGAERAFLLRGASSDDDRPCVVALWTSTQGLSSSPSRSLARQVLAPGAAPLSRANLHLHLPTTEESVRALRLHWVVAAPVPASPASRLALVLDSRNPPRAGDDARALVDLFASVLALVLRRTDPRGVQLTPHVARMPLGRSEPFLAVLDRARAAARTRLPVLVTGESGTGKEAIARLVHDASPRREGPFVSVNCAALPETLLESELFGARRGAFTGADRDRAGLFAAASGGTLFLDEIGDMSPATQATLLRTLQERTVRPLGSPEEVPVDVRLVAATHRDMATLVREGRFRADLYYRVAVLTLHVPPLRERRSDIPLLSRHLLARLHGEAALGPVRLSEAACTVLAGHDWPGNVRELEAVLARAALLAREGTIEPCHLDGLTCASDRCSPATDPPDADVAGLERGMIASALAECGGSVTRAARRIGWTRQKLYRRMRALGLTGQASASVPSGTTSSASSTFQ